MSKHLSKPVSEMTSEEIREYLRQPATSEQREAALVVHAKPSSDLS